MNNIGDKLKKIRLARNMTQGELADKMGLSRHLISRWETGDRNINADQLNKLAQILGVTLDYFQDAKPERTLNNLMSQLEVVFMDAGIPASDKDKAYQDIMKIYLKSKDKE